MTKPGRYRSHRPLPSGKTGAQGASAWAENGLRACGPSRADFAFRQAFALCPYSPEAVFRYVNRLIEQKRFKDAVLVARTASKIAPDDRSYHNLVKETERLKASQPR
jgi:hypothetical protein